MDYVQWSAPKSTDEVDRRVVVNPRQARALLEAVRVRAPQLVAFFGCMYYTALRPAEALHLRADECELPETGRGWLRLTGSTQHVGHDGGDVREDRELNAASQSERVWAVLSGTARS
jgi:integrase